VLPMDSDMFRLPLFPMDEILLRDDPFPAVVMDADAWHGLGGGSTPQPVAGAGATTSTWICSVSRCCRWTWACSVFRWARWMQLYLLPLFPWMQVLVMVVEVIRLLNLTLFQVLPHRLGDVPFPAIADGL
jgi:hypothetical protein